MQLAIKSGTNNWFVQLGRKRALVPIGATLFTILSTLESDRQARDSMIDLQLSSDRLP